MVEGLGAATDGRTQPTDDRPDAEPVSPELDASVEGDGEVVDERARRNERLALAVFVAYLVIAFPILLYIGRDYWFRGDDWGLLAGRDLNLDDLFRPQNRHWSTVPILSYKVLYAAFGLQTYLPYMAVVIGLHLGLAGLIRVVMRRAGVGPWVATIVASVYVLFSVGAENYFLSIQVSMMTSMVCGFGHLILADHDGPFDRRDALGLLVGLIGLMSSGIAPPMVIIVGTAVLIRRGPLLAAIHTVPLGVIYGIWYLAYREEVQNTSGFVNEMPPFAEVREWVWYGMSGVFVTLGEWRGVAIALAVMLVVGLVVAWAKLPWSELRRRAAMPAALLLGAVVLFGLVSTQRWLLGPELARSSRYLDLATALVLPALAVAAGAIAQRWKPFGAAAVVLVAVGIPFNLVDWYDLTFPPAYFQSQRRFVVGAAYSDVIKEVPSDAYLDPNEFSTDTLTTGFLVEARRLDRLPERPDLPPAVESNIVNRLSMGQSAPDEGDTTLDFDCEVHQKPLRLEPDKGDEFGLRGPVQISIGPKDDRTHWSTFRPAWSGDRLTAQRDGMIVHVRPVAPATSFTWCTAP